MKKKKIEVKSLQICWSFIFDESFISTWLTSVLADSLNFDLSTPNLNNFVIYLW